MHNQVTLENIEKYCKKIRPLLGKNTILSISGPMGVGKTTFIKHLLPEFQVSSPSFLHALNYGENFLHIDAYTFKSDESFLSLEIEEELKTKCVIIEWGELMNHMLNNYLAKIIKIVFTQEKDKRFLKIMLE